MTLSLFLRVILHYRYNYTLRFKPKSLSLIGDKLYMHRPDLGRAFAGMCDQNDPLLNRYIEQNQSAHEKTHFAILSF